MFRLRDIVMITDDINASNVTIPSGSIGIIIGTKASGEFTVYVEQGYRVDINEEILTIVEDITLHKDFILPGMKVCANPSSSIYSAFKDLFKCDIAYAVGFNSGKDNVLEMFHSIRISINGKTTYTKSSDLLIIDDSEIDVYRYGLNNGLKTVFRTDLSNSERNVLDNFIIDNKYKIDSISKYGKEYRNTLMDYIKANNVEGIIKLQNMTTITVNNSGIPSYLDLEILHDTFSDIFEEFISHQFVNDDIPF